MPIAKNLPKDGGLTRRIFFTGLLLVLLYGAVIALLIAVGVKFYFVLVIAGGLMFAQYWFSDKLALWGMHGQIVTPEQAPELHGAIDRLCALADMPKPRVAIADTDIPNAFATGRSPKAAVVCATSGLLRRLDEPEIEAVLAHELSHVAHRDVAIMTIASTLGVAAGIATRAMFYAGLFGGGGRGNNQSGQQLFIIEMFILLVSVVVYVISFLLTRALSRYRELAADRSGAILIGRPSLLASALVKITGEISRIPTRDLRQAEAFNAFFFTPAISQAPGPDGRQPFSLAALFSTHPSLERRLAQLSELEAQLGQPSI
ncbi:MAG TPA: zinc metalloprotease HtpX [Acidimicrobiales bacterium]|nr:zinc metalloprotease HtpX [Acidimicrobiales bacterium]